MTSQEPFNYLATLIVLDTGSRKKILDSRQPNPILSYVYYTDCIYREKSQLLSITLLEKQQHQKKKTK